MGKNVIFHSFDFANPVTVAAGGIINLPETDEAGNPVYLVDEFGELLLDWKGDPHARLRERPSGALHHPAQVQGRGVQDGPGDALSPGRGGQRQAGGHLHAAREGFPDRKPLRLRELPARRAEREQRRGRPDDLFQDPFDPDKPVKMLRWGWTHDNLADSSAKNPYNDARAHRGALNGDELLIGYTWTPNWGRRANDKYDFYVRRSFDGGQNGRRIRTTTEPIEHNVVFRVPIVDYEPADRDLGRGGGHHRLRPRRRRSRRATSPTCATTASACSSRGWSRRRGRSRIPSATPPGTRRTSRTPACTSWPTAWSSTRTELPDDVEYPKMPLDIYYSRTRDKGQRYESVIVTPQGGSGRPRGGVEPPGSGAVRGGRGAAAPDPERLADVRGLAGAGRRWQRHHVPEGGLPNVRRSCNEAHSCSRLAL